MTLEEKIELIENATGYSRDALMSMDKAKELEQIMEEVFNLARIGESALEIKKSFQRWVTS